MAQFSPVRDTISAGIAVAAGLSSPVGWAGVAGGLIGTGFKKAFTKEDSGFGRKFFVGVAATLMSGGFGLIPYLIAAPGGQAKADVQNVRQQVVADRYDNT